MRRSIIGVLAGVLALSLAGGAALADGTSITVPNGSFEQYPVAVYAPGFPALPFPYVAAWQHSAEPAYWASSPYPTAYGIDWDETAGVFLNDGSITNMVGAQAGFLFAVPQNEMYQDLTSPTATYQVGQSYHLTVGVIGGGGGMVPGTKLDLVLYYRDLSILTGDNRVAVASYGVVDPPDNFGTRSEFMNFTVDTGVVTAADPWAGQPIGIQILADASSQGGYWDVENVVLVPEPASLALLAVGAAGLGVGRRRR